MISHRQVISTFAVSSAYLVVSLLTTFKAFAEEPVAPVAFFALTPPTLRMFDSEPSATSQTYPSETTIVSTSPTVEETTDIAVESKRPNAFSEEAYAQIYQGLNGPILTQIAPEPEPAGALGWVQLNMWDPIFALESIKIRKVYVTGSIITAIQRKNPLCLLNPLILAVDF